MTESVQPIRPVPAAPHDEDLLAGYAAYLARTPLARTSQDAYRKRIRGFLSWLAASAEHGRAALEDPLEREYAIRDYLRQLRVDLHRPPTTVNAHLAAVNNFYAWLGLGRSNAKSQPLQKTAPRSLEETDVRRLLRTAERRGNQRDTAILVTLLGTGLRLAEVAALDLEDVAMSARTGIVTVRDGKGGRYRQVPLNAQVRAALVTWLAVRSSSPPADFALFIGPSGRRLTTRALDLVLRRLSADAGVAFSAHVLRHTAATRLVRSGIDLVLVADILGHSSLETTRAYSRPSMADRTDAVELLAVEH